MKAMIAVLGGDGIGPEVTRAAARVLGAVGEHFGHTFEFQPHVIGGASLAPHDEPLTRDTLHACLDAHAVLLGAVGGPQWDQEPPSRRPEQGLLRLREGLETFANLRPVRVHPVLEAASPLRPEVVRGTDILFVRELTGGLYFGQPKGIESSRSGRRAVDTLAYTEGQIRRVLERGFRLADSRRRRVTSVDKANVLASSQLWRSVAEDVHQNFPDVTLEHLLVDACAMQLMQRPTAFDVVVTENLFGDILTNEAAVLAGSIGLLPSASLGEASRGLYEPVHGSAPDIAGKGVANPVGAILSAALLLRHSLGLQKEATAVEDAVDAVLTSQVWTRDLGGHASTNAVTDAVVARLARTVIPASPPTPKS